MKKIITLESSGAGVDMEGKNISDCLIDLQIILRIERLVGEELPGNQFEAAELACGFLEKRKIRKKAKKTNSWVWFLKTGEGMYLLLTPSVKIIDEDTENLTQTGLILCLAKAEVLAWKQSHSLRSRLNRQLVQLKIRVKEKLHFWKVRKGKIKTDETG